MRKLALAAIAATVIGMLVTSMPASAQSRLGGYNPGIGRAGGIGIDNRYGGVGLNNRYVNRYGGVGFNNRYVNRGIGWDNRYYNNRYYNGGGMGYRPFVGAGIGLGAAAAYNNRRYVNQNLVTVEEHAAQCAERYRSYNPATNQFLGYDGDYHECRFQ